MANEKKPSIYDDHDGIGSSSELDEYGVWVKSEPLDINTDDTIQEISDLAIPDAEDLPDFGDELLNSEPEKLGSESLDGFDLPEAQEMSLEPADNTELLPDALSSASTEELDSLELNDGILNIPELDDVEELQIEDVLSVDADFMPADSSLKELDSREVPTIDAAFNEQSLPNSSTAEEAPVEDSDTVPPFNSETTDLFMENFLDESPFDEDEDEKPVEQTPVISETEEQSGNAETAAVEEAPEISPVPEDAPAEQPVAEEPAAALPEDVPVPLVEQPVAEEPVPENTPVAPTEQSVAEEPATAVPEDVPVAPTEQSVAEEPVPEDVPVTSVVQPLPEAKSTESAPNLSTELLLRIAEELSSIRRELSTLKQEFLENHTKPPAKPVENTEEEAHQGGFFDDSDDEKIALTGDELDNILLSADFTEETGADATEGSAALPEFLTEAAPQENDEAGELSAEDELFCPEPEQTDEEEMVLLDPDKDSEELQRLREEGVEPITPAPDDTSYLETDSLDTEIDSIDTDIDLSNAVIDEPDLSGKIMENPLQEPILENISFDDAALDIPDDDLSLDELSDEEAAPIEEGEPETPAELPVPALEPEAAETPSDEAVPESFEILNKSTPQETPSPALKAIPSNIQQELKTVLAYMDQLLESLPEDKIEEFAASKYFDTYKKLFAELGLV